MKTIARAKGITECLKKSSSKKQQPQQKTFFFHLLFGGCSFSFFYFPESPCDLPSLLNPFPYSTSAQKGLASQGYQPRMAKYATIRLDIYCQIKAG